MNLSNKVALVTGGSQGLGFSVVKQLLSNDVTVHILSRNINNLNQAKGLVNSPKLYIHQGNSADYKVVDKIVKDIGKIDILINNAGLWIDGKLEDNDPEYIDEVIETNVKGVINPTKIVLPSMLENNEGFIINISSTSGLKARPKESIYAASKYAVRGFTDALKEDLKDTNVKLVGFYPGGMHTQFFSKAGSPKENKDWMDTEKVANIILTILKQDDTLYMDHVVVNKRGTLVNH
jgi:uncharacterized protein